MKVKLALESVEAKKKPFEPKGWIGVDLDGTLAEYLKEWQGWKKIGDPVEKIVTKIKEWLKLGIEVRVLTARVGKVSLNHNGITFAEQEKVIQDWCEEHIGVRLPVTSEKDMFMLAFLDDSAIHVNQSKGTYSKEDEGYLSGRIKWYLKQVEEYEKQKEEENGG